MFAAFVAAAAAFSGPPGRLSCAAPRAAVAPRASLVVDITSPDDFERRVAACESLAVVKWFTPNCRACRALAPKFEALAEQFEGRAEFFQAYPLPKGVSQPTFRARPILATPR